MTVFKTFINFDKEEAWLADMARNGYRLTEASLGHYRFDKVSDNLGEFTFKIDYRSFPTAEDFRNYCMMFEDYGWLHIAGTRWSGSQYFVKIKPDAGDDIFSDNLSRAGRYKRISTMWLSLALAYTPLVFLLISISIQKIDRIYLTPGLWEKKGWHFVLAFLFETPFVLLRLSGPILYLIIVAYYARYAIKSYNLYKKEILKQ